MARAGHADAYKQLPLNTGEALAAVVTLRNPFERAFFPFTRKAQLLRAMAAVCVTTFSRIIALLTCRVLKIPCVGYHNEFGIVAPLGIPQEALASNTDFDNLFRAWPTGSRFEAGATIEFLAATAHDPNSSPTNLADLPPVAGRRAKLVNPIG